MKKLFSPKDAGEQGKKLRWPCGWWKRKKKTKVRLLVYVLGPDEPMKKG